ncbi:Phox/Bem1p, partial [Corchorus olitorius]
MTNSISNKRVFCYCHIDGRLVVNNDNSLDYIGGTTIGIVLNENTTFQQLVQEVEGKLGKSLMGKIFKYTLDFDKTKLIDLVSDACLKDLIYFSGRISQLYVFQREMPDIFNSIEDQPQNIVELE